MQIATTILDEACDTEHVLRARQPKIPGSDEFDWDGLHVELCHACRAYTVTNNNDEEWERYFGVLVTVSCRAERWDTSQERQAYFYSARVFRFAADNFLVVTHSLADNPSANTSYVEL